MEIDSRRLRVICAVIDTASLQEASSRVALSASAISRIVSAFEQDLGVRLFDRSERRLTPTEAGRAFQARAREALLLLEEVAAFGKRSAGAAQPLRVAALSRHAETLVAPAMAALLSADPNFGLIRLDVHAQRDFGFSRLARPFDVGVGHLTAADDEFESADLALSPLVACFPPGKAIGATTLTPQELRGYPIIGLSGDTVIGSLVREALAGAAPLNILVQASHTYVALALVRRGIGIHITDELAALDARDAGCPVVPLAGPPALRLRAFWPRLLGDAPRIGRLIDAVKLVINERRARAFAPPRQRL